MTRSPNKENWTNFVLPRPHDVLRLTFFWALLSGAIETGLAADLPVWLGINSWHVVKHLPLGAICATLSHLFTVTWILFVKWSRRGFAAYAIYIPPERDGDPPRGIVGILLLDYSPERGHFIDYAVCYDVTFVQFVWIPDFSRERGRWSANLIEVDPDDDKFLVIYTFKPNGERPPVAKLLSNHTPTYMGFLNLTRHRGTFGLGGGDEYRGTCTQIYDSADHEGDVAIKLGKWANAEAVKEQLTNNGLAAALMANAAKQAKTYGNSSPPGPPSAVVHGASPPVGPSTHAPAPLSTTEV